MTAEVNAPATTTPGRVLVTGGASGLGAAVVDAVLKAGGTPVVLDRDISNVSAVKAFEVDVADRAAVEAAVKEAARLQASAIGPEVGTPEARAALNKRVGPGDHWCDAATGLTGLAGLVMLLWIWFG